MTIFLRSIYSGTPLHNVRNSCQRKKKKIKIETVKPESLQQIPDIPYWLVIMEMNELVIFEKIHSMK